MSNIQFAVFPAFVHLKTALQSAPTRADLALGSTISFAPVSAGSLPKQFDSSAWFLTTFVDRYSLEQARALVAATIAGETIIIGPVARSGASR